MCMFPTREESIVALRVDYYELLSTFNPRVVQISREPAPEGALLLLKVRVIASTYMLDSESDRTPKPISEMTFYVEVHEGYPIAQPRVYYPQHCRLASVNVYQNGEQSTVKLYFDGSLSTLVKEVVGAILYDPRVAQYYSVSCSHLEAWQRAMEQEGTFPTGKLDEFLV